MLCNYEQNVKSISSLNRDKPRTLQLQIRQQLVAAINKGLVELGDYLPLSRALAIELGVARNTVVAAFKELEFDGYLKSEARIGYHVSNKIFTTTRVQLNKLIFLKNLLNGLIS